VRATTRRASPPKKAPAKKAAVKQAAKKRAANRPAKKPARMSAKKQPAKKSAAKRVTTSGTKPRATRHTAKKRAMVRTALRKATPRTKPVPPAARAVPPAVAPVPPAFSVQRAGASAREELLFELARARAAVKAATQGLTSGHAERPIAPGKWSIKEIVLHLSERDRVRLEEFGRTLGGQPRSWAGATHVQENEINEIHLAPLRTHTWDEAVRRMDSLREQLLWRLSQLPAQPDDVWQRGHAFGDMMWALPGHDRLHAEHIKLARLGELVPVED
jgi:hypothetical protein